MGDVQLTPQLLGAFSIKTDNIGAGVEKSGVNSENQVQEFFELNNANDLNRSDLNLKMLTVDGYVDFSVDDMSSNPLNDKKVDDLSSKRLSLKDVAQCLTTEPAEAELDKEGMLHEKYLNSNGSFEVISNPNAESFGVGTRIVQYNEQGEFEFATDILGIDYYDENGNKTHSRYAKGNSDYFDIFDSKGELQYRTINNTDPTFKEVSYIRFNSDGSQDIVKMDSYGNESLEHH